MSTPTKKSEKSKKLRELLLSTSIPDNKRINIFINNEEKYSQKVGFEKSIDENSKRNQNQNMSKNLSLNNKDQNVQLKKADDIQQNINEDQKMNALKRFRKAAIGIKFTRSLGLGLDSQRLKNDLDKELVDLKDPQDCDVINQLL